ncbi:hypothetical protein WJX81_000970 [Elliptochloris bilobata]|uniref:Threonine dehydratase n=1 Tax=Elliptochloris bilobata TaxID=381761 RepID=A0AAW1QU98_9CHLO
MRVFQVLPVGSGRDVEELGLQAHSFVRHYPGQGPAGLVPLREAAALAIAQDSQLREYASALRLDTEAGSSSQRAAGSPGTKARWEPLDLRTCCVSNPGDASAAGEASVLAAAAAEDFDVPVEAAGIVTSAAERVSFDYLLQTAPSQAHTPAAPWHGGPTPAGSGGRLAARRLSRSVGGSLFKAPRRFMSPMRNPSLTRALVAAGAPGSATPSRLQHASSPGPNPNPGPRVAVHDCGRTLLSALLVELSLPAKVAAWASNAEVFATEAKGRVSPAVAALDAEGARSFPIPAHEGVGEPGQELGAAEFAALLVGAGADARWATLAWTANHLRWVVWKLAALERRYPRLVGRALTAPMVLDQLKYRYERELARGQRPVLKKVLEQDEPAGRCMVLCLAAVLGDAGGAGQTDAGQGQGQGQGSGAQVEITDGWYSVCALLDAPLSALLTRGRLQVGAKLRICGAELVAGAPAEALVAARTALLRLHVNGTHRAHAFDRLGWTRNRGVYVPLSAVHPDGGAVPRMLVVVRRRLQTLVRVSMPSGTKLTRTQRAHAAAVRASEADAGRAREAAALQATTEELQRCRQLVTERTEAGPPATASECGAALYARAMLAEAGVGGEETGDPLTPRERALLETHTVQRHAVLEARRADLEAGECGSPAAGARGDELVQLQIAAVVHKGAVTDAELTCSRTAVVSLWRPGEDAGALREGGVYVVVGLQPRSSKRRGLQLNALREAIWQPANDLGDSLVYAFRPRRALRLPGLADLPRGADFDFKGVLLAASVLIEHGWKRSQWLFLADESVEAPNAWLLAVQLEGPPEAVDWVDPLADVSAVVSLRDLRASNADAANGLWRAEGDETCCVTPACQGPAGCQQMQWRTEQGGYLREILTARVYDVAVETPLEVARGLSEELGCTLLLKREDLQPVFSFKLRGAYNKMASLSAEQLTRGVICSSAGNHAQGVALAASHLGCEATVCMPVTTPDIKVEAVRRLGGRVELIGDSYSETQTHAQRRAKDEGLVFVAPYDDPLTVAGQGTIGTEILRQLTSAQRGSLHAVFVAVGGGGLVAGIAAYVKALHPSVKVIGVEPTGANAMAMSLACGERVTLSKVDAFADGVAVKQVGAETFRLCRELVDGVVLVDNGAISAAIRDVFNETRCILEPAGAVAVAGAKAYLRRHGLQSATAVAVTSGANMNFDRLHLVAELASVGARAEATFATTIPERPGAFADFVAAALDGTDTQITELKYRYSAGSEAHILWGAGLRAPGQAAELQARLEAAGLPTLDVSAVEAAQVHLRHLVGGRARSYMGELPCERIFQVEFPERAGALARFLAVVSPAWNVTLFHYRRTGNRSTVLLVGIQVPPASNVAFAAAQAALAGDYTFSELSGESRRVFDMFLS